MSEKPTDMRPYSSHGASHRWPFFRAKIAFGLCGQSILNDSARISWKDFSVGLMSVQLISESTNVSAQPVLGYEYHTC